MARVVAMAVPTALKPALRTPDELRKFFEGVGVLRMPDEAEEPILAPNARAALMEWMTEIRCDAELRVAGLSPRRSALMFGPPGCGKTTMAHHIAARLGLPMLLVGAETIMKPYLGQSEQVMTRLFDKLDAIEGACLVFLDEIEAVGGSRSRNSGGGADNARNSILTVLLRRIERCPAIIIGATNRQQDLDPALWRRFGLQVDVDLPGDDERFAILRRYMSPFELKEDDADLLSSLTDGASPALLRGLMEGVKRALIVGPKLGWPMDAPSVFRRILAALRPPPEFTPPALWAAEQVALMGLEWPPERVASV